IAIRADEPGYVLWSILHQRGMIALPWGGLARTSYPLLPWIGVIAIRADEPGYVLWSILHQRGMIALPWGGLARTS
ncbi:hypothetical protein CTI14_70070, partial [Methylobacterium radiotolerans]